MLEKYKELNKIYENYVILIVNGKFLETFNKDAIVVNRLVGYKLMIYRKYVKLGFSIDFKNRVLIELEKNNINYIVYYNSIVDKVKFKYNMYKKYYMDFINMVEN